MADPRLTEALTQALRDAKQACAHHDYAIACNAHVEAVAMLLADKVVWRDDLTVLQNWWEMHRPVGWAESEHLANPTVNCTSDSGERELAYLAARLVERRG